MGHSVAVTVGGRGIVLAALNCLVTCKKTLMRL